MLDRVPNVWSIDSIFDLSGHNIIDHNRGTALHSCLCRPHRLFPWLRFCAKAGKKEKKAGCRLFLLKISQEGVGNRLFFLPGVFLKKAAALHSPCSGSQIGHRLRLPRGQHMHRMHVQRLAGLGIRVRCGRRNYGPQCYGTNDRKCWQNVAFLPVFGCICNEFCNLIFIY